MRRVVLPLLMVTSALLVSCHMRVRSVDDVAHVLGEAPSREFTIATFNLQVFGPTKAGRSDTIVQVHTRSEAVVAESGALEQGVADAMLSHSDPDVIVVGDFNAGCDYARSEELTVADKPCDAGQR